MYTTDIYLYGCANQCCLTLIANSDTCMHASG